jgi:hypothetical protein
MISSKHICPWLAVVLVVLVIFSYGDKFETIQPPGTTAEKTAAKKVEASNLNVGKTRALFNLASNIEVGDKVGLFELRSEGILIHPGETKPTKVTFKVNQGYKVLNFRAFISTLPADATAMTEAGTVGVEFLLDGESNGRVEINRDSSASKTLDLTNVNLLTVVVDNSDGKPWFDWLMLSVVDRK